MQNSLVPHRRSQRRTSKQSQQVLDEKLLVQMHRLVTLNEAQTTKMVPQTPDIPRSMLRRNRTFTASFSYTGPTITSSTTSENPGSILFVLSNVPGYTSWTSSFDSYRIIRAYVEFIPYGIQPSNATIGNLVTAIDYDDGAAVVQTSLLQYDTAMMVNGNVFFERRLVPRAAKALYSGSAFTSYGQDTMPWIDSDSPSVPHYGIKYSQSVAAATSTWTTLVTLEVNFRNNN